MPQTAATERTLKYHIFDDLDDTSYHLTKDTIHEGHCTHFF